VLTRLSRGLVAALLGLGALAVVAAPAHADVTTGCTGIASSSSNCSSGTVTVTVGTPGGDQSAVGLTSQGTPTCSYNGAAIPCDSADGWWSAERQCYVHLAQLAPPPGDPVWQGHTAGAIYSCIPPDQPGLVSLFWASTQPVSPADVRALAGKATQSLNLRAIDVGMAPTPTSIDPSSIGIVGLPNWLWVKTPSSQTWGPATGTASDPGVTVTVTAQVGRVAWDMGDGTAPIVCSGPGTPYNASYGKDPSPTCGHSPGYQKQGTYPLTAVSHWTITYTSNVGISGTLTMDLTSTASVTIGELQTTVVR
jgi:hypothetical protein